FRVYGELHYLSGALLSNSNIAASRKLLQEFIVDMWATTEQSQLRYLCLNQSTLRADVYQGIADIIRNTTNEEVLLNNLEHRIIFLFTYIGSSRHILEVF
ncbi:30544_t:CDS:2, partial [Racocetra persica]